ncbi:MAG: methyltransferase domain-containing protein [Candidatus Curtissbacteria bacterium]|nr:methyltransferase domain-containing protein [Candidatus Curtissbacteria bacterium]
MKETSNPYKLLDIGIGSGGNYLKNDTPNTIRVGLDYRIVGALKYRIKNLPHVRIVAADAEFLPFTEDSFDEIQIYFPFPTLLDPGLQNYYSQQQTWYQEFARVLKPRGKLTIIGDRFLKPDNALSNAAEYFTSLGITELTPDQVKSIGSITSTWLAEKMRKSHKWEANRIELRKN